jgi:hypothetical protein
VLLKSSGTKTSEDSIIRNSSFCTPNPDTSFVVPCPSNRAFDCELASLSNSSSTTTPPDAITGLFDAAPNSRVRMVFVSSPT